MTDFRPRDPSGEPQVGDARKRLGVQLTIIHLKVAEAYFIIWPEGMDTHAAAVAYRWAIDSRLSLSPEQGAGLIKGICLAAKQAKEQ